MQIYKSHFNKEKDWRFISHYNFNILWQTKSKDSIAWLCDFWCGLFHWLDYISLILWMYMYLVDPFHCIYMYMAVKNTNISCDFMAVHWSDPLGFRDWINSAPPENILRLVTCLRILMREPEFQKVFYTIHGLQVLSEVTNPGKYTEWSYFNNYIKSIELLSLPLLCRVTEWNKLLFLLKYFTHESFKFNIRHV